MATEWSAAMEQTVPLSLGDVEGGRVSEMICMIEGYRKRGSGVKGVRE